MCASNTAVLLWCVRQVEYRKNTFALFWKGFREEMRDVVEFVT